MRRWSILAVGLGFGLFIGALSKSPVALWAGIMISVAGMVAYVASLPAGDEEPAPVVAKGLGTRVDQLLRLAREQAEEHAAEIIARAEQEAGRIRTAADDGVWVVWRQDDNGNRSEVARVPSRGDADALAATMEARGHRQIYWVAKPSQVQRGIDRPADTRESAGE